MYCKFLIIVPVLLASCFKTPLPTMGTVDRASRADKALAGTLMENGVSSTLINPSTTQTQIVSVPAGSAVSGSTLTIPPGSLAVSSSILFEEATSLTTPTNLSELAINSTVLSQGIAVSVQSSEATDAKKPLVLSIPLPLGLGLSGTDLTRIGVLYRVTKNVEAANYTGLLPRSNITIADGYVRFETYFFGAFQAVLLSTPPEAIEVKVSTPAFSKSTLDERPRIVLTSASAVVAKAGETITIHGSSFRSNMVLALGNSKVGNLQVQSDVKASFVVPVSKTLGKLSLSAEQDGVLVSIPAFYLPGAESLPIITLLPAAVCEDVKYYDQNGAIRTGAMNCSGGGFAVANCSAAGQTNCVTTLTFPSMDVSAASTAMTDLNPTNFSAALATNANFEFWDSTGTRYQLSGTSNLSVGNVKSGVLIFGVTGQYPSAAYTLPSASAAPDLDSPTFNAKVKVASAFEYWNSAGSYQLGSGDANLTASNIVAPVSIFGSVGTVSASATLEPWNIRSGVTINGVLGALKTSCRNKVNSSIWDAGLPLAVATVDIALDTLTINGHNFTANTQVRVGGTSAPTGLSLNNTTYYVMYVDANTIKLSSSSGPGVQIDLTGSGANVSVYQWNDGLAQAWDTIDDSSANGLLLTNRVLSWTPENDCNEDNWQDVTPTTCLTAAADCIMKDRISNMMWSEVNPVSGNGPGASPVVWQKSIRQCDDLIFGGHTDWRLPTEKELMEAHIHGMRNVGYNGTGTERLAGKTQYNNSYFAGDIDLGFWSATTISNQLTHTWNVGMSNGSTFPADKSITYHVLCIRNP